MLGAKKRGFPPILGLFRGVALNSLRICLVFITYKVSCSLYGLVWVLVYWELIVRVVRVSYTLVFYPLLYGSLFL